MRKRLRYLHARRLPLFRSPSLTRFGVGRGPSVLYRVNMVVDCVLLMVALFMVLAPREATFVANIATQVATIEFSDGDMGPEWGELLISPIEQVSIGDNDAKSIPCDRARLEFPDRMDRPVTVRVTAREGLQLFFSTSDPRGIGLVRCSDRQVVPPQMEVLVKWTHEEARHMALLIDGRITAGAVPSAGDAEPLILESGILEVAASSFPFSGGRASSEVKLQTGDELSFLDNDGQMVRSFGLLRYHDNRLNIVLRAKSHEAIIHAFGQQEGSALAVAPTFWTKLQAQSEWAIILFCAALLLNMISATQSYWSLAKPDKR